MTLEERFWNKVKKGPGCWEWKGAKNNKGYGMLQVRENGEWKRRLAHRISYEISRGYIPIVKKVCHKCDNPSCVRPDHLFEGTMSENMFDKVSKGRDHNTVKTHCPKGHPYTGKNLYIMPCGGRDCKICIYLRGRKRNDKSKAKRLSFI
jgi:hypothetical protein